MHIDAIMFGFRIGYSSGVNEELIKDCQILKPTIFASFPLFYTKIEQKIKSKLSEQMGIVRECFEYAVMTKMNNYQKDGTYTHTLYDYLFF